MRTINLLCPTQPKQAAGQEIYSQVSEIHHLALLHRVRLLSLLRHLRPRASFLLTQAETIADRIDDASNVLV